VLGEKLAGNPIRPKGPGCVKTNAGLMELSIEPVKDGIAIRPIPHHAGIVHAELDGLRDVGGVLIDEDTILCACGAELFRLE